MVAYLRMLQERYNAPLRIGASHSDSSNADTFLSTAIVSSADMPESTEESAVCSQGDDLKGRKEEFL